MRLAMPARTNSAASWPAPHRAPAKIKTNIPARPDFLGAIVKQRIQRQQHRGVLASQIDAEAHLARHLAQAIDRRISMQTSHREDNIAAQRR